MISRRISRGARLHLVANRQPSQPVHTYLRPSLFATSPQPPVEKFPTHLLPSRYSLACPIHCTAAAMSSTIAPTATPPSDSPSDPSQPAASKTTSTSSPSSSENETKEEPKLPPLKGAEFRAYNRLAEHMDLFHAHFRTAWNTLWAAACAGNSALGKNKARGRAIIGEGLAFVAQLEVHHNIEETYIFPVLARRMPEFQNGKGKGGKNNAAELLRQHSEIHDGMEGMRKYLRGCRDGENDLDMATLKKQMETWGKVLWTHLDQEVETLGAENMRKYWTAEEIRQIPM
ncbi:hypothetical protein GGR53DRAFT_515667 [Hypoxylon sp. FL1150]|nr:hypothetical protein GGR53DRAFT_515667 [Hypoxylon sp. FL1150]